MNLKEITLKYLAHKTNSMECKIKEKKMIVIYETKCKR